MFASESVLFVLRKCDFDLREEMKSSMKGDRVVGSARTSTLAVIVTVAMTQLCAI